MKRPKTFREIAEMHYGSEPSNVFDKQYRQNRINALEKLLTEQLRIHDVVGQSEQLEAFVDWWHGLSQEELAWYEGRYVEVFLNL